MAEDLNEFQNRFFCAGGRFVCGVDEVGRGPLAGPVVACAVVFDCNTRMDGLADSKKISAKKRKVLKEEILSRAVSVSYAFVSSLEIDRINIYQASKKAMLEAVANLKVRPELILADAMDLSQSQIESVALIRGDQREECIMAASIVAKEVRDEWMKDLGCQYPGYGFEKHMGYGTKQHMDALETHGVMAQHRRSFMPVLKALLKSEKSLREELGSYERKDLIVWMNRIQTLQDIDRTLAIRIVNERLKEV